MLRALSLFAVALLIAACGGSTPSATDTPATSGPIGSVDTGATEPPITTPEPATPEPAASLAPGEIQFRVVNLLGDDSGAPAPVDVYVRTQGLVQAAPVVMGLAYSQATDYFAPPEPGNVVITTAGAGDPTCVAQCDHIISSSSTGFGEGNERTLIVHDEGTLELWHDPEADSVGQTGNALAPADPSTALLYVVAVGLRDADFGLRLGFAGEEGCQVNRTSENVLVGGNQVALFGFDDGSADVLLYDNRDTECAEAPVGGPFAVSGEAGSRTLLVLYGSPGAMEALTLEV